MNNDNKYIDRQQFEKEAAPLLPDPSTSTFFVSQDADAKARHDAAIERANAELRLREQEDNFPDSDPPGSHRKGGK